MADVITPWTLLGAVMFGTVFGNILTHFIAVILHGDE